jgi:hypothetical protein
MDIIVVVVAPPPPPRRAHAESNARRAWVAIIGSARAHASSNTDDDATARAIGIQILDPGHVDQS